MATRVTFLTDYQNAAYADRYKAFVGKVRAAETALPGPLGEGSGRGGAFEPQAVSPPSGSGLQAAARAAGEGVRSPSTKFSEAVVRYLFKLMAYKDEYEVARLHTDKGFHERIDAQLEGDYKLHFHLAPPMLAKTNDKGEPVKQAYGPWMLGMFGALAKFKGLRGSAFDLFGRSEERRTERALIAEYRACIDEFLQTLSAERLAQASEIARIPEEIRGYDPAEERHLAAARAKWAQAINTLRAGPAVPRRAA